MMCALEVHPDREEEAARRGIRRDILSTVDVLVAEVADLGIETAVLGPGVEVATARLEANRGCRVAEHAMDERGRQLIRERDLAQLHEPRGLDVARDAVDEVAGADRG